MTVKMKPFKKGVKNLSAEFDCNGMDILVTFKIYHDPSAKKAWTHVSEMIESGIENLHHIRSTQDDSIYIAYDFVVINKQTKEELVATPQVVRESLRMASTGFHLNLADTYYSIKAILSS